MSRIGGPRQRRHLSIYFLVLALLGLGASVLGLATGRLAMALYGLPFLVFMLLIARVLAPSRLPESDDRLVAAQERFFRRLGIKWLSGPDHDATAENRLVRRRPRRHR